MTVTATSFRADFPEFADTSKFATETINLWIDIAYKLLFEDVWAEMLDHGVRLFVAHHLLQSAQAQSAAASGSISFGANTGVQTSKSVGPVSVGYDAGRTTFANAGNWNKTVYGVQMWQLIQMFGAGGVQL